MNLVDAIVKEVNSEPFQLFDKWWVRVTYDCYGIEGETELMFLNEEDAKMIEKGYKFLT